MHDTESVADASMLIGKERYSLPATLFASDLSTRRHRPRTTHLQASTMPLLVAPAVSWRYLHAAGRSATATRPVQMSLPASQRLRSCSSVALYAGVKFLTFLTSMEGVDLYADRLICMYSM